MTMYISVTRPGLTAGDIEAMAQHATRVNASLGISGMLVHADGYFLQVLEGDEPLIRDLVSKISTDPRHTDFHIILQGHSNRRNFSEWSMGIVNLEALKSYEVLRDAKILTRFLALTGPEATADAAQSAISYIHSRLLHTRQTLTSQSEMRRAG